MRIFIAGGTGFTGRHLLPALREAGHELTCLVRDSAKAEMLKSDGVQTSIGDITDRESLKGALDGAEMVIHLVGIIEEGGGLTFEDVHVKGTDNLVCEASVASAGHFVYQSALGASQDSKIRYESTKAGAEEVVKASGIPYTIFRPSLIVGDGDGFTTRIRKLVDMGPAVPVPGSGEARFQPIYVGDWVRCVLSVVNDRERYVGRTIEFGGPEQLTYDSILKEIIKAMGEDKGLMHLPYGPASVLLPIAGGLAKALGLKVPTASREQLELLQKDNVCDPDSVRREFGFEPVRFSEALKLFI